MIIDCTSLVEIQNILSLYISAKGFISWAGIKKACQRIIEIFPEDKREEFLDKNYPEFDIFIPLLRNGSAEVCRYKDRMSLLFCMNPKLTFITENGDLFVRSINSPSFSMSIENKEIQNSIFEKNFSPQAFLKSYTAITIQVEDFPEQDISKSSLKIEQNLFTYSYESTRSELLQTGIYKTDIIPWYPSYLVTKNQIVRKISYYAEDPDSMNLARLYVRITNKTYSTPIFLYDQSKNELKCFYYSELPILLSRALLLLDPNQITLKEFCSNHPNIPFKNVTKDHIHEIKRIFSDESVKII